MVRLKITRTAVFTPIVVILLALGASQLMRGVYGASPVQAQSFQSVEVKVEANLQFGWVLYSRQISNTNEVALIVMQSSDESSSAQCQFNNSNVNGGVQLSAPMQMPNGELTYDLFINRTAQSGAADLLHSLEEQSLGDLLHSAQNFDLGDLGIGDIHGAIIVPSDISLAPSITC